MFHGRQSLSVVSRMGPPMFIAAFQAAQFYAQNRSLDPVHATIPPDHRVIILLHLAMIAQGADFFLQLDIVSYDGPRFPKRAKVFAWIKTEATCNTDGADGTSV